MELSTVGLDDADLTVARWGHGEPKVVMLHDGLGSIDQWRSIPGDIAERTGRCVLAYDRPGHGKSTPVPSGPWPADWLHTEAKRLDRLLGELEIRRPVLIGHSDGGSIALIHAAAVGAGTAASDEPRGVLTLAAHSWVEQLCFDSIADMRNNTKAIVFGLARSHPHPAEVFEAWSGAWVSDGFRPWDIRPILHTITCPTVIAQGANDEYASQDHAHQTAAAVGGDTPSVLLDGVGHLMHHQDPDLVVDVVCDFVADRLGVS